MYFCFLKSIHTHSIWPGIDGKITISAGKEQKNLHLVTLNILNLLGSENINLT